MAIHGLQFSCDVQLVGAELSEIVPTPSEEVWTLSAGRLRRSISVRFDRKIPDAINTRRSVKAYQVL